ncbi:AbiH family protein [uncultured Flavobacterium sp.]|uniref:AbiH family protein n=1 Tax=uncultured Flavobacterium sp. TaxID=165435 RepID=UPI0030EBBC13
MNRLILIGNGFDLAHNLKTSYSDFLCWYINDVLESFFKDNSHKDLLVEINSYGSINQKFKKPINLEETLKLFSNIIKQSGKNGLTFKYRSNFFKEIVDRANQDIKWVDFENHYFSYLKRYANAANYKIELIRDFNDEFEFIKSKLHNYLISVEEGVLVQNPSKFDNLITNKYLKKDFTIIDIEKEKRPENIYVLNFNYTSIFQSYLPSIDEIIPTRINHIHGVLNEPKKPIIFGFGDEHDTDYLSFEDKKNNELFKHIKSFQYSKTSNYQDLIRFINSNNFQVYIIGHSCGLSDRTMLKEIFEHDNCKSIKIYYYKWGKESHENDYIEKTYEISRHFTNKGMMRKKVVPFDNSDPLF